MNRSREQGAPVASAGKVQATARVQVTVEFAVGGVAWSGDTQVELIHRQARERALDILRQGLVIGGLTNVGARTPADVVGEPTVTTILVVEQ